MSVLEVTCPRCNAKLKVPAGCIGRKGRCTQCGEIILIDEQLLAQQQVSDEDVMSWLASASASAPSQRPAPAPQEVPVVRDTKATGPTSASAAPVPPSPQDPKTGKTQSPPAKSGPSSPEGPPRERFVVQLSHVDEMGAFFVFDSRLLYDEQFRSSFQQKCVICGGRNSLSVHLVDWPISGPRASGKTQHHLSCVFDLDKFHGLSGTELLEAIGQVSLLREPYCLPFPYYVCHFCSSVGTVVTAVRQSADGQSETCELGIASLERAHEFAVSVCGPDSEAAKLTTKALEDSQDHAWRELSLAVRNRISQWFKAQEGEAFAIYVPDVDFSRAEAGMAGVVVTDRRLVYHKALSQMEMPLDPRMSIEQEDIGDHVKLRIVSSEGKAVSLNVSKPAGLRLMELLGHRPAQQGGVGAG